MWIWMNRPWSSRQFFCFAKSMQFLTCRASATIPAKSAINCYLFSTSNNEVILFSWNVLKRLFLGWHSACQLLFRNTFFIYSLQFSGREKGQERVNKTAAKVTGAHPLIPRPWLNSSHANTAFVKGATGQTLFQKRPLLPWKVSTWKGKLFKAIRKWKAI